MVFNYGALPQVLYAERAQPARRPSCHLSLATVFHWIEQPLLSYSRPGKIRRTLRRTRDTSAITTRSTRWRSALRLCAPVRSPRSKCWAVSR
eukprot:scaffold124868_cov28-Tisochrysis_lutea.AAC.3